MSKESSELKDDAEGVVQIDVSSLLWVEVLEAKPNRMFTEDMRRSVRFLRYNRSVKCAECGKKKRTLWTMLCEFRAKSFGAITLTDSGKVHSPLTPVCSDHPLAWAVPKETPTSAGNKNTVPGEVA